MIYLISIEPVGIIQGRLSDKSDYVYSTRYRYTVSLDDSPNGVVTFEDSSDSLTDAQIKTKAQAADTRRLLP